MHDSLSILLPVRNAQTRLVAQVEAIVDVLPDVVRPMNLLVIDDASQDGTEEIAWELATRYPQIDILRHPIQLGIAESIRTGIAAADGDFLLICTDWCEGDIERMAKMWIARGQASTENSSNHGPQSAANAESSAGWLRRLISGAPQLDSENRQSARLNHMWLLRRSHASELTILETANGIRIELPALPGAEPQDELPIHSVYHHSGHPNSAKSSSHRLPTGNRESTRSTSGDIPKPKGDNALDRIKRMSHRR